jgi:hypothetical protein
MNRGPRADADGSFVSLLDPLVERRCVLEFLSRPGHVPLDRLLVETESGGDFGRGPAGCEEQDDHLLGERELGNRHDAPLSGDKGRECPALA